MAEDTFSLQTPAAKVLPKVQYTNLLCNSFYKCIDICASPDATPESVYKKIEFLSKTLINFIPNPVERERLKSLRKGHIEKIKKQKNLDADEKNDMIFDVNTDILGEVMELCDDFLALVERQCVMPTTLPDRLHELENKFYPNGLPSPGEEEENKSES